MKAVVAPYFFRPTSVKAEVPLGHPLGFFLSRQDPGLPEILHFCVRFRSMLPTLPSLPSRSEGKQIDPLPFDVLRL